MEALIMVRHIVTLREFPEGLALPQGLAVSGIG
jgi:hypothetical protein